MVERRTPEQEVRGFDSHSGRRVVSLSNIYLLVIPRKWWPHPNMTEKLFIGMLSKKKNNRKTKTDVKHVNLKTGLNIMHLYCITNTSISIIKPHPCRL